MTDKPALVVINPGFMATLQDAGRKGYQRFGVSQSGALDLLNLRIANLLVGNDPDDAGIEYTASGGQYECHVDACRIALTGAEVKPRINDQSCKPYRSFLLRRGDRLEIGAMKRGFRGYLAIAGGFDVTPVLGSRSTHLRSGLGGWQGRALIAGDRLPLREPTPSSKESYNLPEPDWPSISQETIRVVFGPQDDRFEEETQRLFTSAEFHIHPNSDRMACILDGPPIPIRGPHDILSDGIANGSIQVSGNGRLTVLMADRQTTGGFPKIATVIGPDLRLLAQRRPGEKIRFRSISVQDAEHAVRLAERTFRQLAAARLTTLANEFDSSSEALLSKNLISGVINARH